MAGREHTDSTIPAIHTSEDVFHSTVSLLEALTSQSSPSGDRKGLDRAMDLYGHALSDRGLRVEIRPQVDGDGRELPVLVARSAEAGPGGLLLVGHMDTVLPAAEPRFEGGRLWATGAVDMKGGLACFVGALDALQESSRPAPRDLTLVVVPDEEVAGHLSWRAMEEHGADARGLWVLEPGQPFLDEEAAPDDPRRFGESVVVGRRGLVTWALDVHGRSAHAGNGFWDGRSALVAAADWCVRAAALSSPGPGPTVNAGRLVAGESGFVQELASQADLLFSPRQTNVVPDRARVEGEARFLTGEEDARLRRSLAELAEELRDRHGVEAAFEILEHVPPLPPASASRDWAERARERAEAKGWRLEIEEDRRGISFPNMLPDPSKVPTLDGLGPVGGGMHTREEFVDLRSVDRRVALLADLLEADTQSSTG